MKRLGLHMFNQYIGLRIGQVKRFAFVALTLSIFGSQTANAQMRISSYNPVHPPQSVTYLVNGLVSAVPFIGYGMANLKKRIPGSHLYSYVSPVEGTAVIQPKIVSEIRKAYRANPNIRINLIGISYGATMVTAISSILSRDNIPVHYLGVIDGRPLSKIHNNVRKVDNFTCSFLDCIGVKLRFASGQGRTEFAHFKFKSTHINLGNNADMHNRVIQQISAGRSLPLDYTATAAIPAN